MKAEELRRQLMEKGLRSHELDPNPYQQFESWYAQTMQTDIAEPTAMSMATVDSKGQPWQRLVLLKLYDEQGFVFFTNYSSRKAEHIETNSKVSLLFPWHPLGRQVKITGSATKISSAESFKYFTSRPRGSQIGAWASEQSKVITSRSLLDGMVEKMKHKFAEGEIPLPSFWGGYRIKADTFEFWQARENRLHDCFFYQPDESGKWVFERLAP